MTEDSKESVLLRWSRRKQEAVQSTTGVGEDEPKETQASLDTTASTETETAPVLTDADMPPIESLDENSDFSGFMSEGVSDELRNLALRKLFKAPVFNIRDGLDEYDEDYTFFEKLGDVVTCDMKHHIEMKEQEEREARALAAEQDAEGEIEAMEAIEDDEDLEAMERIEDADIADKKSEIVSNADLQPENNQSADK
ncbi:MAG: DUF3306 domain-containing protein [Gammaproteobacteria bacterium]|nr:DUF3306 domain-containing protein [Gammaproteobacteria bacterium]